MKKSNNKERGTDKKGLVKHSIKSALLGLIVTMAFMFIISALMLTGAVPDSLKDTMILVAVVIGATASGLYCASKRGGGVVVAGITAAAAYIILVLLGTILFGKSGDGPALTLKIIIASVAGGCFGGVLKLNKKRKKSRLRR